MSIDIATALREEAEKAHKVAERVISAEDKKTLTQLAARLEQIAERLERDARD
jgi:metal-dependent HD superfamily phosphatase/phosphodiesterase